VPERGDHRGLTPGGFIRMNKAAGLTCRLFL